MNKKISKIKRVLALCLIFLFSINTFAAIVSDNDGSAFVTKAEFDALKKDFNEQIDNYNASIDGKIDGAIASYLAGIQLSTSVTKATLINNYDYVTMYENNELKYEYARPEWHILVFGEQSTFSTSGMYSAMSTQLAGFFNAKVDYTPDASAYGCKELSIEENASGKPQPYIWKQYHTNVKRQIASSVLLKALPADSTYSSISWVRLTMAPNKVSSITKVTSLNGASLIAGAIWAYRVSTVPQDNAWDHYGPCIYNNYTDKMINAISLDYSPDDRSVNKKWESNYIIAYQDTEKPCNNYSIAEQFAPPISSAATESQNTFFNSCTVSGTHHLEWDGFEIYHNGGIGKYTSTNTYMALTDDVPIYGGLGLVKSNDIRQIADGLVDSSTVASIKLEDMSLNAGFPLLIEKKEANLYWDIKFVDNKTYKVWLSYEKFDTVATTGIPSDTATTNIKFASGDRYAIINNGTGRLNWTMEYDSPVYVKWIEVDPATFLPLASNPHQGVLKLNDCNTYIQLKEA